MDIEFDEVPESLVIDRGPKVNLGLLQSILRPKRLRSERKPPSIVRSCS